MNSADVSKDVLVAVKYRRRVPSAGSRSSLEALKQKMKFT